MNAVTAELLLKIYYTPDVKERPLVDSPSITDAFKSLTSNHLISVKGDWNAEITDRGAALVRYWLETPLPNKKWEVER